MPDVRTFFRHCPSCGRRFEIRLVSKELVSSESSGETEKRFIAAGGSTRPAVTIVQEDVPSIVDVEDFRYGYKCKHCVHEWSEIHEKVHRVGEPEGYTGD